MTTTAAQRETTVPVFGKPRSPLAGLWRIARRKPVGAVAGVLCVLLILVAVFADQLKTQQAEALTSPPVKLAEPSSKHLFGTDNLFRDMYSRIVVGSRVSLGIGFSSVALGTLIGTILGIISGYAGGWTDLGINRVMDTVMAFPPLILAMFMLSIFKPSFISVTFAIGIIIMPATARIVRGSVLGIKNLQYVEAALSIGSSHGRIMARHVLPNVIAPIIIIASIQIGNAILAEAALSFLSLGIATASQPSWGKMLQDTRAFWEQAWWTAVIPGAAISVAVLSFNLFGDALRDVLDPRLRGS
jgi:ABC-type dipeptide/oligopeptide/nickel transport system permease subunit